MRTTTTRKKKQGVFSGRSQKEKKKDKQILKTRDYQKRNYTTSFKVN